MPKLLAAVPVVLLAALAQPAAEHRIANGWTSPESSDYQAGIDRGTTHGGHPGLFLKLTGARAGDHSARQSIQAALWRGKRVRLGGWVKADRAVDGGALWLRVDMPNGDYILDNNLDLTAADRSRRDAGGWTRCDLVADVPRDAIGISFGLRMKGRGQIWAADLRFSAVGATVRTTTIERRGYRGKPGKEAAIENLRRQYTNAPGQPVNLDFTQP